MTSLMTRRPRPSPAARVQAEAGGRAEGGREGGDRGGHGQVPRAVAEAAQPQGAARLRDRGGEDGPGVHPGLVRDQRLGQARWVANAHFYCDCEIITLKLSSNTFLTCYYLPMLMAL